MNRRLKDVTGTALGIALAAACAGTAEVPAQTPNGGTTDAATVDRLQERNRLAAPLQVVFDWSLQEREGRFNGEGATRIAPPDHARLDLFGPRGEGYLSAAFVRGEVRLPPDVTSTPLPPTALMWSALGVFQPPAGTRLERIERDGNRLDVTYGSGDERWVYRFEGERLRRVEWTAPGGGRRTVELQGDGHEGVPGRAVYRDWRQFIELRLTLKEAIRVDGFPQDIWQVRTN